MGARWVLCVDGEGGFEMAWKDVGKWDVIIRYCGDWDMHGLNRNGYGSEERKEEKRGSLILLALLIFLEF